VSKSINQKLAEFGLRIEVKKITELKRYPNNPRLHNELSIEAIQRSIDTFGFKNVVVVDNDYEVIAGHGRLDALERIGKTEVPVLVATDLDKWQAAALRIADNKATDVSTWDYDALKEEIQTLEQKMNLEVLGFSSTELEILQEEIDIDEFFEKAGTTQPKKLKHKCPKCGYEW
jgi:ParB family chromosome partitioning protein